MTDRCQCVRKDVIRYVAGSVVKKLKKKVWGLKKGAYRYEKLRCLEALRFSELSESDCDSSTDMTTVLNRGGLTFVKDNIVQMFLDMQDIFRRTVGVACSAKMKADDKDFLQQCQTNDTVPVLFYDTVYAFDISLKVQEDVFENAVLLFFLNPSPPQAEDNVNDGQSAARVERVEHEEQVAYQ